MTLYRLNMTALVDAESESAARQAFIDGDWGGISLAGVDRFTYEYACAYGCGYESSTEADINEHYRIHHND